MLGDSLHSNTRFFQLSVFSASEAFEDIFIRQSVCVYRGHTAAQKSLCESQLKQISSMEANNKTAEECR